MSDSDIPEFSARDLMPDWVSDLEKPSGKTPAARRQYENFEPDQRDRRARGRGPRDRSSGPDQRRGGGGAGGGAGGRFRDKEGRGDQGRGGGPKGPHGQRDDRGRGRNDREREFGRGGKHGGGGGRPPADPLPEVEVTIEPTPESVEALARHIRSTGRAYSMVEVARNVLASRDRYQLRFSKKKKQQQPARDAEGGGGAALLSGGTGSEIEFYRCKADGSLWLSRAEAMTHILKSPAVRHYYDVEDVEVEAPKGNFEVIAVCSLSGRLLGPPNHHEYQRNVMRLYQERFSNMPFERYKSRIEMKRDEETLEKWKALVSKVRHYRVKQEEPEPAEATPASTGEPDEVEVEASVSESDPEAVAETDAESETDEGEVEGRAAAIPSTEEGAETLAEEPEAEAPATTGQADETADGEPPAESPKPAPASSGGEVLKSEEALERHFRKHFAGDAVEIVDQAVVPGDIPGRNLSRELLEKLKASVDSQKRGFPLPLMQELCRQFETTGLKFFKRGKKTLYVSMARPRAVDNPDELSPRLRKILEVVRDQPKITVKGMLAIILPGYEERHAGEEPGHEKASDEELGVLADLRWLLTEGYLIEFPSAELALGRDKPPTPPPSRKKQEAPAAAASETVAGESKADQSEAKTEAAPVEPGSPAAPESTTAVPAAQDTAPAPESEVAATEAGEATADSSPVEVAASEPEPEPAAEAEVESEPAQSTAEIEDAQPKPEPEPEVPLYSEPAMESLKVAEAPPQQSSTATPETGDAAPLAERETASENSLDPAEDSTPEVVTGESKDAISAAEAEKEEEPVEALPEKSD